MQKITMAQYSISATVFYVMFLRWGYNLLVHHYKKSMVFLLLSNRLFWRVYPDRLFDNLVYGPYDFMMDTVTEETIEQYELQYVETVL